MDIKNLSFNLYCPVCGITVDNNSQFITHVAVHMSKKYNMFHAILRETIHYQILRNKIKQLITNIEDSHQEYHDFEVIELLEDLLK